MLRIFCVFFIFGLYKYCNGSQADEWKQHLYQPRRDYSNRTQNEGSYLPNTSENLQSQVSFTLFKPRIERQINESTETNIGVQQSLTQWRSNESQNESNSRRRPIPDSIENNALKQNEIGWKNYKKSLRTNINAKPKRLIYFRSRNNQNSQLRNAIRATYDKKQNDHLQRENNQESRIFSGCCSITSNVLFVRNTGSKSVSNGLNSFKGPTYLPPLDMTRIIHKSPDYLPPTKRPHYPINKITNDPTKTATTFFSTQAITSKKPFIPILNQIPATKQPYCKTCISTSGPFYIPVTQSTLPSIFETNTYQGIEYDPAKAMLVPAEEDEGIVNSIPLPPKNDQADNGTPNEEGVELKANIPRNVTSTFPPVDRVNERGDVPDKEESTSVEPTTVIRIASDDQSTLTTDVPSTQQMMYTPKIATTKMTLMSTDPSITSNKKESGPTTQTNMRNTTPFKGLEYLPPDDTTMKTTVIPTTPQSLVAPAMAMPVPLEPEEAPPMPSPVTATTASTTIVATSFMPTGNRYQTEENLQMNTSFSGSEYLPPKDPRTPTATELSGVAAPALAMLVPPEPEDMLTPTSSTPETPTDAFRAAESPSSTPNTPIDTNFRAPEYLPPKEVTPALPPSPAMAMPVPKESDCENDPNNTPYIDPRFADTDSCGNKKPTEPFKGPPYLPPSAKTRVEARLIKV